MPVLNISNEQVIEMVKQLPISQQTEIFQFLLLQNWEEWESLSNYAIPKIRLVAQERGYNWDTMTETERETLIDEIVHEV